jgi:outer membrane biogenesis lipoprotein LolB
MLRTVALALAALVLVGCSSDDQPGSDNDTDTGTGSSEQPRTEAAAREVAQEQADRYAAGDFGGAWDLWADEARDTITREDYVRLGEECLAAGVPVDVTDVRLEGDDRAVVRLGVGTFEQAYTMRYEDGAWRWMPTPEVLEDYDGDVDRLIQQMNDNGQCVAE